MPQGYKTDVRELRFLAPTFEANGWSSGGATAPTLLDEGRAQLNGANGWLATGDRGMLIDNILQVDITAYVSSFGSGDTAYIGMASGSGAAASGIAEACWFKLVGDSSLGPRVYLESKDGTTTVADEDTGINLRQDKWNRFTLDFAMGIQTISPPGKSKGGKGAIQYAVTNDRGWSQSPLLTKFLDMWNYAGFLQPFILNEAGTGVMWVEGCDIYYRRYGSQE